VAREVGTEGKLGGQAVVRGEAGIWKDLTDNVNSMAANLTSQVRNIADVTTAVARGDLSKKVTVEVKGEILELKDTINTMVDQLNAFASEVTRVAKEVGTDGRLGGQAYVRGVGGTWKDLTDNVNSMADNLTGQVRNIAEVTKAVANGDLSRKITVDVRGEILELKNTINTMVDQLNAFASEVTRVAREVGTEGKLGGQAMVRGVAGIWKDLTDNVNTMADNLTAQVRGIARVVTAVANGDLKRKLVLEAKGEIAILADTINGMIDTLAIFADQVTGVAREVGVEGRLGGQAEVPGAAGTWRDLTDNVNRLAANLTTQVRAIAEVATAVTEGDLTRSIAVEARGEVASLKDNINEMIRNLKETTQKNQQQDWLNSNLARFGRMLQGQRDLETVSRTLLSELAGLVSAHHGLFYVLDSGDEPRLNLRASYAHVDRENRTDSFSLGEGLVGQCALERERILLNDAPPDYVRVTSGLGDASPLSVAVLPVLFEGRVKAVIELASLHRFSEIHLAFLEQLMESIGIVLNTIGATMQTEDLLRQSQLLTERLRAQQEQLQKTNDELAEKARLLTEQKAEVEVKNREVELASRALEEKAEQLALTSKYKSEFLANMSHELRTPLNSILILAKLLADDPDGTLTNKQVEFAETIHSCGRDLLGLINEILDLSKIESGTMVVDVSDVSLHGIAEFAERGFRPVAETKGLRYGIRLDPQLPATVRTDPKRLQQVLRNLLSNAFKFTEKGEIRLEVERATSGWTHDHPVLSAGGPVIAFQVSDTGIGIPADKHRVVFEAFQQVDGTASRRHGGTGLGLSISREIARLLGGEIRLESEPGRGSTFTLFLPAEYSGAYRGDAQRDGVGTEVAPPPRPTLPPRTPAPPPAAAPAPSYAEDAYSTPEIEDDRDVVRPGDRVILIVEDDPAFANILLGLARERGFRGVVAHRGDSALFLARRYPPAAVILDVRLPGMDGWTVLDRMKHDPATRNVPVHVMSVEEGADRARMLGAQAYLEKPVTPEALQAAMTRIQTFLDRDARRLLVVEDDDRERRTLAELLGGKDVEVTCAGTGEEALEALRSEPYDCVVLDLMLPDMGGESLLSTLRGDPELRDVPVVVYTGKELDREEAARLERMAGRLVRKGEVSSDTLLAETALFLHRMESDPKATANRAKRQEPDRLLAGRTALVVDDDVRNVFAITSMLERHGLRVRFATNGREAIQSLQNDPNVDAILLDIMMPEMDGYATAREIRRIPELASLPIIALTAKAMRGDREKCLEAGASDYLAKPVEVDQLLSMLRVWISK
jgi:CheY-like chemotaxis protein/signal transduction histidine kinase/HAMP domain-containing protein